MSEIQELYLYKILHIINYRLSVESMLALGLEYSQIVKILSRTLQDGLVENGEEGLFLTERGKEQLKELGNRLNPDNVTEWIMPADEYRIQKIDMFAIYLPRKSV